MAHDNSGGGVLIALDPAALGTGKVTMSYALHFKCAGGTIVNDFDVKSQWTTLSFYNTDESVPLNITGKIMSSNNINYLNIWTYGGTSEASDGTYVYNFGEIYLPNTQLRKVTANSTIDTGANRGGTLNFRGKITASSIIGNYNDSGYGNFHFFATNEVGIVSCNGAYYRFEAPDVFTNAVFSSTYPRSDTYEPYATYILNGKDQDIGAMYSRVKSGVDASSTGQSVYKSTDPATITISGAVDSLYLRAKTELEKQGIAWGDRFVSQSNHAKFDGAISLVYDPSDAGLSVFSNRTHTMTGTIRVKRGTFETSASYKNVPALTVDAGATFRLKTTTASVLSGLRTLTVGGTFDIAGAVAPLTPAVCALAVSDGGKIVLPANETLYVSSLTTNGIPVIGGFTAENCDWIEGAGAAVRVRTVWTKADYDAFTGETIDIAAGGELEFAYDSTMTSTVTKVITGGGSVRVSGAGRLVFAAANTYAGGFTMSGTGYAGTTAETGFGTGKATLAGTGILAFDGTGVFPNDIDVTAAGTIRVNKPASADKFTLAGDITATSDFVLDYVGGGYMPSDSGAWPYDFAGTISAPGKRITIRWVNSNWCTFNFRKAVACDKLVCDPNDKRGLAYLHFFASSAISLVSSNPGTTWEADNVFPSTVWLTACYGRNNNYHSDYGYFDLKGHAQTVGKLHSEDLEKSLSGCIGEKYFSSASGGVLTLAGEGGYRTRAILNAGLEFVFSPTDSGTVVFSNMTHETEGPITVSKGTFATAAATSFPNLKEIVVKSGAVFELNTSVAQSLGGLRKLKVEDGGIFRVTASPEHFTGGQTELVLTGTAKLEIPTGVVADFELVRLDGTILSDDTYTSGWITGGGSAKVDSSASTVNYWRAPVSGVWKTGANWNKDTAPTAAQTASVTAPGNSYVATVDETATVGALEIGNEQAAATATVSVGAKLSLPDSLPVTIQKNGVLAIADGGVISNENTTGQIVVKDGGKMSVASGGQVTLYNKIYPSQSGTSVRVEKGGAFEMTGGQLWVDEMTDSYSVYNVFSLDGGSFTASGDAHMAIGGAGNYPIWIFGTGTARFMGNSALGHIKLNQRRNPVFRPTRAGETSVVEFVDHAMFGWTADGTSEAGWFGTGLTIGGTLSDGRGTAILRLGSDQVHNLGYATRVGEGQSRGEIHISNGQAKATYSNLIVPCSSDGCASEGLIEVTGGSLYCSASSTSYYGTLYGLQIGNGCRVFLDGQGQPKPATCRGELVVSGTGAVTNYNGRVTVGIGIGEGKVRQEGGEIQVFSNPAIVGFVGGEGLWKQTGGTATLNKGLYVGGVTTNELGIYVQKDGTPIFPADWHDAEGTLELRGGSMTVKENLVLSADGTGMLVLGANANLTVTGALDARAGSKLKVDVTGYEGRSRTIATFASVTQDFDPANVERVGETEDYRVVVANGRVRVSHKVGALLIVR